MWSWLSGLLGILFSAVKPLLVYCAMFNMGKKSERDAQARRQSEKDFKALANAVDARNAVVDDDNSMLNDPRNRDRSDK